uniref:Uncharacterized protein n=1 Tax=Percolomonas cosmopolitus TaxID=63605 RepID=A0A7S1KM53_9EUKA|mmetsp:Transcript_11111/g.41498  ORF Transcript_11111/g.41498 Transcript_11111/m.41498 type:complete len:1747 (+) Transcript_11111:437-5677(+)|eukprot:CAMPEP_0117445886 /NCGR_PEP_ID=MMETSP0759-20121206/6040_1 /TAXON_ID=63605 /ORGANISM="Percolomonas cosmopolitus, Strain WS" /LENGTH=1746 /DNA_ID=CAMNT_0005238103 /DNA_START=431 /DNA_END=5671 /DNA_ORIENTATION=+
MNKEIHYHPFTRCRMGLNVLNNMNNTSNVIQIQGNTIFNHLEKQRIGQMDSILTKYELDPSPESDDEADDEGIRHLSESALTPPQNQNRPSAHNNFSPLTSSGLSIKVGRASDDGTTERATSHTDSSPGSPRLAPIQTQRVFKKRSLLKRQGSAPIDLSGHSASRGNLSPTSADGTTLSFQQFLRPMVDGVMIGYNALLMLTGEGGAPQREFMNTLPMILEDILGHSLSSSATSIECSYVQFAGDNGETMVDAFRGTATPTSVNGNSTPNGAPFNSTPSPTAVVNTRNRSGSTYGLSKNPSMAKVMLQNRLKLSSDSLTVHEISKETIYDTSDLASVMQKLTLAQQTYEGASRTTPQTPTFSNFSEYPSFLTPAAKRDGSPTQEEADSIDLQVPATTFMFMIDVFNKCIYQPNRRIHSKFYILIAPLQAPGCEALQQVFDALNLKHTHIDYVPPIPFNRSPLTKLIQPALLGEWNVASILSVNTGRMETLQILEDNVKLQMVQLKPQLSFRMGSEELKNQILQDIMPRVNDMVNDDLQSTSAPWGEGSNAFAAGVGANTASSTKLAGVSPSSHSIPDELRAAFNHLPQATNQMLDICASNTDTIHSFCQIVCTLTTQQIHSKSIVQILPTLLADPCTDIAAVCRAFVHVSLKDIQFRRHLCEHSLNKLIDLFLESGQQSTLKAITSCIQVVVHNDPDAAVSLLGKPLKKWLLFLLDPDVRLHSAKILVLLASMGNIYSDPMISAGVIDGLASILEQGINVKPSTVLHNTRSKSAATPPTPTTPQSSSKFAFSNGPTPTPSETKTHLSASATFISSRFEQENARAVAGWALYMLCCEPKGLKRLKQHRKFYDLQDHIHRALSRCTVSNRHSLEMPNIRCSLQLKSPFSFSCHTFFGRFTGMGGSSKTLTFQENAQFYIEVKEMCTMRFVVRDLSMQSDYVKRQHHNVDIYLGVRLLHVPDESNPHQRVVNITPDSIATHLSTLSMNELSFEVRFEAPAKRILMFYPSRRDVHFNYSVTMYADSSPEHISVTRCMDTLSKRSFIGHWNSVTNLQVRNNPQYFLRVSELTRVTFMMSPESNPGILGIGGPHPVQEHHHHAATSGRSPFKQPEINMLLTENPHFPQHRLMGNMREVPSEPNLDLIQPEKTQKTYMLKPGINYSLITYTTEEEYHVPHTILAYSTSDFDMQPIGPENEWCVTHIRGTYQSKFNLTSPQDVKALVLVTFQSEEPEAEALFMVTRGADEELIQKHLPHPTPIAVVYDLDIPTQTLQFSMASNDEDATFSIQILKRESVQLHVSDGHGIAVAREHELICHENLPKMEDFYPQQIPIQSLCPVKKKLDIDTNNEALIQGMIHELSDLHQSKTAIQKQLGELKGRDTLEKRQQFERELKEITSKMTAVEERVRAKSDLGKQILELAAKLRKNRSEKLELVMKQKVRVSRMRRVNTSLQNRVLKYKQVLESRGITVDVGESSSGETPSTPSTPAGKETSTKLSDLGMTRHIAKSSSSEKLSGSSSPGNSSAAIEKLKRRYLAEINKLKVKHQQELDDLRSEQNRRMDSLSQLPPNELLALQKDQQVQRMKEKYKKRIKELEEQQKKQVAPGALKEIQMQHQLELMAQRLKMENEHNKRLKDIEEKHRMYVEKLKADHQRMQLENMTQNYEKAMIQTQRIVEIQAQALNESQQKSGGGNNSQQQVLQQNDSGGGDRNPEQQPSPQQNGTGVTPNGNNNNNRNVVTAQQVDGSKACIVM